MLSQLGKNEYFVDKGYNGYMYKIDFNMNYLVKRLFRF